MGEYLSPGVYSEFIEPIAPIEPVSTSTAAMIGVSERGPENVPILVGAPGEFERWFGSILPIDDYRDPFDARRAHCYLPHSVQGFFANGGKRLYALRVMPGGATRAAMTLFARDPLGAASGLALMTRAAAGDTQALIAVGGGLPAVGQSVRIGDGSAAEYRAITVVNPAAVGTNGFHVAIEAPLAHDHAAGAAVAVFIPVAGSATALTGPVAAADAIVTVNSAVNLTTVPAPGVQRLALSGGGVTTIATVNAVAASVNPNEYDLTLAGPIGQGYAATDSAEVYADDPGPYALAIGAVTGSSILATDVAVAAGSIVELGVAPNLDARRAMLAAYLPLAVDLPADVGTGAVVEHVTLTPTATPATTLTAGIAGRALALAARTDVVAGSILLLTDGPIQEYAVVASLFGPETPAPDPGTVMLVQAPTHVFPSGAGAQIVSLGVPAPQHAATQVVAPAHAGDNRIAVLRADGWGAGENFSVQSSTGVSYHLVSAAPVALVSARMEFAALDAEHAAGSEIAIREPLLDITALDRGRWGNRLRISVEDEISGLAANAAITGLITAVELQLSTISGLQPGSNIEVSNPASGASLVLKVRSTDPATTRIRLEAPGLDAAALAILGPVAPPQTYMLRSREFRLTIALLRRPDPAEPSRNEEVISNEVFRNLSLDPRHARYAPRILGDVNGALRREDRRPEGESLYIRLSDRATTPAQLRSIRLGPETLIDHLPNGRTAPARHPLTGGVDDMAGMVDNVYIGADNADAELRTGLFALCNVPDVSLVAIPGQGSARLQAEAISHCELMRYRVAILDAAYPDSSIAEVQNQRQQFDTHNAALYYPWLQIPDPTPVNLANIGTFSLPPSGHMLGIIARADEEGVHVPPGNMVVRGITGISRLVTKTEHDVLNPSPTNINVIRDFTDEGRGYRVYGARTITSDTSRKYLNVNRLIFFVQKSLEVGLQWAVLRPNSAQLWAAVRQSVTFFLYDVWRSGAFLGGRPEEAFIVACDETTMSPSDLDNGRLICIAGIAPVKPAEFVILRLGFLTRTATQE